MLLRTCSADVPLDPPTRAPAAPRAPLRQRPRRSSTRRFTSMRCRWGAALGHCGAGRSTWPPRTGGQGYRPPLLFGPRPAPLRVAILLPCHPAPSAACSPGGAHTPLESAPPHRPFGIAHHRTACRLRPSLSLTTRSGRAWTWWSTRWTMSTRASMWTAGTPPGGAAQDGACSCSSTQRAHSVLSLLMQAPHVLRGPAAGSAAGIPSAVLRSGRTPLAESHPAHLASTGACTLGARCWSLARWAPSATRSVSSQG